MRRGRRRDTVKGALPDDLGLLQGVRSFDISSRRAQEAGLLWVGHRWTGGDFRMGGGLRL